MSIEEMIESAVERAIAKAMARVQPTPTQAPELVSVTAAARLADVSPSTIRQWLKDGLLKRYGSGRAVRVRREDVLNVQPKAKVERTADDVVRELFGKRA